MPSTTTRAHSRRIGGGALFLLLALIALLSAAAVADAARPGGGDPRLAAALQKKKHHDADDDDDGPAPSPDPSGGGGDDDDDAIAQMKKCHAERGKGRDACLAVPHCEFCTSASALPLPDVCAHELEAKLMPGVLWECEKPEEPGPPSGSSSSSSAAASSANGDACEGLGEPACAASTGVCVWCVAAAVPSSCFTVDQAKALPPGVFTCELPPSISSSSVAVAAS
jgi:hypothetical protein